MRKLCGASLILLLVTIINCKEDEPIYPIEPYVEFRDLEVKRVENIDSVILQVYARDGDFDLGLNFEDIDSPYHKNWYYDKLESKLIPGAFKAEGLDINSLLKFSDRQTPSFDTLPEFIDPYACINYEVLQDNFSEVIDTVYYQENKFHYNWIFDFQVKQEDGSWLTFDFHKEYPFPNCAFGYYGRFKIQNDIGGGSPFLIQRISDYEMNMKFLIGSPFMSILFRNKTIRFQLYIYDRALNQSNIVHSSEFQFPR